MNNYIYSENNVPRVDEPRQWVSVGNPDAEPITLAEAKRHLIVDAGFTGDDDLINAYIAAARASAVEYCGMSFTNTNILQTADYWPLRYQHLRLDWGNVSSVTSVQYIDTDGTLQTWDSAKYVLNKTGRVARIVPAFGETWPTVRAGANSVRVNYVSGFGADASSVPPNIKQALLLIVGTLYEQRMDSVYKMPTASQYLLNPFNVRVTL